MWSVLPKHELNKNRNDSIISYDNQQIYLIEKIIF